MALCLRQLSEHHYISETKNNIKQLSHRAFDIFLHELPAFMLYDTLSICTNYPRFSLMEFELSRKIRNFRLYNILRAWCSLKIALIKANDSTFVRVFPQLFSLEWFRIFPLRTNEIIQGSHLPSKRAFKRVARGEWIRMRNDIWYSLTRNFIPRNSGICLYLTNPRELRAKGFTRHVVGKFCTPTIMAHCGYTASRSLVN